MTHFNVLGLVNWQRRQTEETEQPAQETRLLIETQLLVVANGDLSDADTAGQLLTAMLKAIDLQRDDVRVVDADHYLQVMEEILPVSMLVMGEDAAQAVLSVQTTISILRQQTHYYGPGSIPLFVTYHPGHLLSYPADKRNAWQDLQALKKILIG